MSILDIIPESEKATLLTSRTTRGRSRPITPTPGQISDFAAMRSNFLNSIRRQAPPSPLEDRPRKSPSRTELMRDGSVPPLSPTPPAVEDRPLKSLPLVSSVTALRRDLANSWKKRDYGNVAPDGSRRLQHAYAGPLKSSLRGNAATLELSRDLEIEDAQNVGYLTKYVPTTDVQQALMGAIHEVESILDYAKVGLIREIGHI